MRKALVVFCIAGLSVWTSCRPVDNAIAPATPPTSEAAAILARANASDSLSLAIARALRSETVRMRLFADLRDSPSPKHALNLQQYLAGSSGHTLLVAAAGQVGKSVQQFEAMLSVLPPLTLLLDRVLDRVRWQGTADIIVYGSSLKGMDRYLAGPTIRGFSTLGESVPVPIREAGPGPYLAILPIESGFGDDLRQVPSTALQRTGTTISTPEEEVSAQHLGPRVAYTMLPPACELDQSCPPGGAPADGIALPAPFTAAYCFGWTGWGQPALNASTDTDADGIRQDCEYQLAYNFRPQVARNSHDGTPEKEPYWSVTRIPGTVVGVRIFYAYAYYRDGGAGLGITAHDGDSEFVIVEVENNMNSGNYRLWELDDATLSAHWNDGSYDHTANYSYQDLEYPAGFRRRPRVWASQDKHANYRSEAVCDSYFWQDVCVSFFTGTVYDDLEVVSNANLGNYYNTGGMPADHTLANCAQSRNPGSGKTGWECFWTFQFFAGWNGYYGQPTATRYGDMLSFYKF
jgi:hypothetical protein